MDSRVGTRQYEDFVPRSDWMEDGASNTLRVDVSGFKKENLKVRIDNHGNLKVSGERPFGPYKENRWIRFLKDFQVPTDCNASEIQAKFDNGIILIVMPKLIKVQDAMPEEEPTNNKNKVEQAKPEDNNSTLTDDSKETAETAGKEKGDSKATTETEQKDKNDSSKNDKDNYQESENDKDNYQESDQDKPAVSMDSHSSKTGKERLLEKIKHVYERMGFTQEMSKAKVVVNVVVPIIVLAGVGFYITQKLGRSSELLETDRSI